jgi:hypothetical protein
VAPFSASEEAVASFFATFAWADGSISICFFELGRLGYEGIKVLTLRGAWKIHLWPLESTGDEEVRGKREEKLFFVFLFSLHFPLSLLHSVSLSLVHAKGTTKDTPSPSLRSLSRHFMQKNKKRKRRRKRFAFHSVDHFGVWVFREQLRFEGFEVRQRFWSPRCRNEP